MYENVLCYVPVLPIVEGCVPDPFYAYDQDAVAPYVRIVALAELLKLEDGHYNGLSGLLLDSLIVHPYALYAELESAHQKLGAIFDVRS